MTIEEKDWIDFTCIDKAEGTLLLAISDHLEWDEQNKHLRQLQTKMNNYLRFIESGEIYKQIPKAQGRKIKILVYLKYMPPPLVEQFFEAARGICQKIDVDVEYEMIE